MVQSLLVVFIVKIGFAKLCISLHQNEKFLSVDIDEDLADCELLDSYFYLTVQVLTHEKFI